GSIRTSAEDVRALGAARYAGEAVFWWHEAAPRDCPWISPYAEDSVPRRTDAGPGSTEPQPALDTREASERDRRRDGFSHDALHGRGRTSGAAARGDRPRQDRRPGNAEGAQRADAHRVA